jgi:hypothetical protein
MFLRLGFDSFTHRLHATSNGKQRNAITQFDGRRPDRTALRRIGTRPGADCNPGWRRRARGHFITTLGGARAR